MPDPVFDPQAIVQKLTDEPVALEMLHQHAEYDDFYKIRYVSGKAHFRMSLEVSVWDGRGHESYKVTLDEAALTARLEEIQTKGKLTYWRFVAKK